MRKALPLLCVLGIACEPMPYQSPNAKTEAPPPRSAFVHLLVGSSPASQVELSISNQLRSVVAKRQVSARLELSAGDYPLRLSGAGNQLYSSGLKLLAGSETLLLAFRAPPVDDEDTGQRLSAYPLGRRDAKLARLRFIHGSLDAPPLALAGPSGEVLLDGVASGAVSAYAELASALPVAGSLQLRLPGEPRALLELSVPDGLALGTASTLVAVGEVAPLAAAEDAFGVVAFDEARGTVVDVPVRPAAGAPDGQIYLFHAAEALGPVTAKSAQGVLWSSIVYQHGTPLSSLPAGPEPLSLDVSAGPLWRGLLRLWPGHKWLLLLYGSATQPRLLALPRPVQAPQTVWRVVNLVDGLPQIDLLDGDDEVVSRLGYGAATPPQLGELKRRALRLRDVGPSSQSWDIDFDQPAVEAARDQVVTLVLTGSASKRNSVSALLLIESRAGSTMAVPTRSLPTTPSL
jgi:hypothetical protein